MMHSDGIYTLANDVVYDQLVALLNSIRANVGTAIPVCVIPFDDRCDRISQEIKTRENVSLFSDRGAIWRWENFAEQVWAAHPASNSTKRQTRYGTKGHHRKFAAFDGNFDRFVFYDADSLAMKPIDAALAKLEDYNFVFDDWEHKKQPPDTALDLALIEQTQKYDRDTVQLKLHCSSFFASKRSIFGEHELAELKQLLIGEAEVDWIPRWWDDAFLFTYLTLRSDRPLFNFTLSPDSRERTGNCANADPFININQVLYNQIGNKPIHRIHYMGYGSEQFTRLSQGENVCLPHQDVFLYYRFLHQPDQRSQALKAPMLTTQLHRKVNQLSRKWQKLMATKS